MSNTVNRGVAGFHMLLILSAVDGEFSENDEKMIRQFMDEDYQGKVNLNKEKKTIYAVPVEDYAIHFNNSMNEFYIHSTRNDRIRFLDMATRLVAADKHISKKENLFLNELFDAWEHEVDD